MPKGPSRSQRGRTDVAGATIAVCAVLMTLFVGYRELAPTPQDIRLIPPPAQLDNWAAIATNDRPRLGPEHAAVTVVEFGDFECPACRAYAATLDSVRRRYPADVKVLFAHFPISYHRFAIPAARAAECANVQGRFEQFYYAVFANQDSLGLMPWSSFGEAVGIPDLPGFMSCVAARAPIDRVGRDTLLAKELGVRGTPTILVNGWKWSQPPSFATLDSVVQHEHNRAP